MYYCKIHISNLFFKSIYFLWIRKCYQSAIIRSYVLIRSARPRRALRPPPRTWAARSSAMPGCGQAGSRCSGRIHGRDTRRCWPMPARRRHDAGIVRPASNRCLRGRRILAARSIANAFTAFLMGVSEPIELLFMFSAPPLFLLHAGLTGISLFICSFFKWTAGFGFSSGLVDYLLSLKIPIANQPYMLLVVGVVAFFIYYFVFTFFIHKCQLVLFNEQTETESEK